MNSSVWSVLLWRLLSCLMSQAQGPCSKMTVVSVSHSSFSLLNKSGKLQFRVSLCCLMANVLLTGKRRGNVCSTLLGKPLRNTLLDELLGVVVWHGIWDVHVLRWNAWPDFASLVVPLIPDLCWHACWSQQVMPQVLGSLSPTWVTQMMLRAPRFNLAQSKLLWELDQWSGGWELMCILFYIFCLPLLPPSLPLLSFQVRA